MKQMTRMTDRLAPWVLSLAATALLVACGGGEGADASTLSTLSTLSGTAGAELATDAEATEVAAAVTRVASKTSATTTSTAAKSFSLDLSWIAPQVNADGSPLTDLAGYRVMVGTSSGNYAKIVTIANPSTVNLTLPSVPAGTYYVVVKAVDAANNESAPTAELVKVLK